MAKIAKMNVPVLLIPADSGPALQEQVAAWAEANGYTIDRKGSTVTLSKGGGFRVKRQIELTGTNANDAPEVKVDARVLGAPNVVTSVDHVGFIPPAQKRALRELREERQGLIDTILRSTAGARATTRQVLTQGPTKTWMAAFIITVMIVAIAASLVAVIVMAGRR